MDVSNDNMLCNTDSRHTLPGKQIATRRPVKTSRSKVKHQETQVVHSSWDVIKQLGALNLTQSHLVSDVLRIYGR